MDKRIRILWLGRRMLDTALVTLCLVAIALLIGPPLLGYRTMLVTGGSMGPAFEAGDSLLLKPAPAGTLRPGDIIAFVPLNSRRPETHRIVSLHRVKGELYLRTKGDANDTPDPDLAPAANVIGRVALRVVGAGRILGALTTPLGRLVLIGAPVLLLLASEVRSFARRPRGQAVPLPTSEELARAA